MKSLRVALATLLLLVSIPLAAVATEGGTLTVFAAASLTDAFRELARSFESAHPGVRVRFNYAGSQTLAAQLAQGAPADVFASADERWMQDAVARGLVAGEPRAFARNRLVVIVPRTNPGRIGSLRDLARRGLKVVLGADAVPVGRYSRVVLRRLAAEPGYGATWADAVLANVVSEEESVKSVVGKVQLGEADAGIVYASDVTPAVARFIRVFTLPENANVVATYPIATLRAAPRAADAQAFVDLVCSAEGQRVLAKWKFAPAGAKP